MTHITCRLTAKNRDQLGNPMLGNQVRATFTFFTMKQEIVVDKMGEMEFSGGAKFS